MSVYIGTLLLVGFAVLINHAMKSRGNKRKAGFQFGLLAFMEFVLLIALLIATARVAVF